MTSVYVDNDGLHAHGKGSKALPHGVLVLGERTTYRAVCECGKVFENGREDTVRRRIEQHIQDATI